MSSGYFKPLICVVGWLLIHLCCSVAGAAGITPDFLMDSDPAIPLPPPIVRFNPALKALWLEALQRPEADMQRMAAETIARGHEFGVPDLGEAVPLLEKIVGNEASHPAARYAAARALIALDSRSSAETLFRAAQAHGSNLRQLIEPVLAEWDFGPARELWIKRLDDSQIRHRELILAIRGLGRVREPSVLARLLSLTNDFLLRPDIRLEAAAAAGQIAESGLEQPADQLARNTRSPLFVNQMCAIRLLARQTSDDARKLLTDLAGHADPALSAAALTRLNEIDPSLVVPLAATSIKSAAPEVRRQAAAAYLSLPTVDRIAPLGELLGDPHPEIRRAVCEKLLQLAGQPELSDAVRNAATTALATDRWQAQEQSALLLGALDHKPAAPRLVELLESPRAEPKVAAAWALRKLAVPETVAGIVDRTTRETARREKEALAAGDDDFVAHLFEALGVLNAADARSLLMQYIPKRFHMGERSRCAAIWTLGRIAAGNPDEELENAFTDRISDFPERNPESDLVKHMCAVGLVRMNTVNEAPLLKSIIDQYFLPLPLGVTLRWAVLELSGEKLPDPEPALASQGEWFLEPLQ